MKNRQSFETVSILAIVPELSIIKPLVLSKEHQHLLTILRTVAWASPIVAASQLLPKKADSPVSLIMGGAVGKALEPTRKKVFPVWVPLLNMVIYAMFSSWELLWRNGRCFKRLVAAKSSNSTGGNGRYRRCWRDNLLLATTTDQCENHEKADDAKGHD